MHTTFVFKQYEYTNDIHVYAIHIYEKQVLHDNYYQIKFVMLYAWISLEKLEWI
jgi:hypothetical protein